MATVAEIQAELASRQGTSIQDVQAELARREEERNQRLAASQAQISQQIARETGPVQAFAASAGRGTTAIGRGIRRIVTPEQTILDEISEEAGLFAPLEAEFPKATLAGQVTGEALPLIAGLAAAPIGVPATLGGRVALGGALGATEAGIIAAGTQEDVLASAGAGGLVGAGVELLLPRVGRLGRALFRRIRGRQPAGAVVDEAGIPTQEFQEVLDEAGLTMGDLTEQAQRIVSGEVPGDPVAAARSSLFDDLGIPTTQSRISQSQTDFLAERQLARDTGNASEILNARLAEESQAFQDVARQLSDDLGLPKDVGGAIKEALSARITKLDDQVTKAYDKIKVASKGDGIPLAGNKLLEKLDDPQVQANIGRLKPGEIQGINDLFIEFGIDTNSDRAADFVVRRQELGGGFLSAKSDITPLNVLNFNEFRKGLNQLIEPGNDALNSVAGSLKRGLDDEIDQLSKSLGTGELGEVGKISQDVIKAARRATILAREVFKVKDPLEMVGLLTKKRKGSFDADQVLASEVIDKIKGKGRMGSVESTEMLVRNLRRAGPDGDRALGNLQSATVLDLLNAATSRQSAKLAGAGGERVVEWSGVNFKKAIDKLGREKMGVIFQTNPQARSIVQKLEAAGDLTVPFATVSKSSGTADDLANFMNKSPMFRRMFGMIGGVKGLILGEGADLAGKKISEKNARNAVQKQINASPVVRDQLQFMQARYPNVAAILGISGLREEEE